MLNTFPKNIDHGKVGRIRVRSEWNADRDPPSRQVWVFLTWRGKEIGSSSVALVEDMGRVDLYSASYGRGVPENYENLTQAELDFVAKISEEFEGRDS